MFAAIQLSPASAASQGSQRMLCLSQAVLCPLSLVLSRRVAMAFKYAVRNVKLATC